MMPTKEKELTGKNETIIWMKTIKKEGLFLLKNGKKIC